MTVTVCLICGEEQRAEDRACPGCGAWDRAMLAGDVADDPTTRLLGSVEAALSSKAQLSIAHAREQVAQARAQRERALTMRLQTQASVLRARMRERNSSRDEALLRYALARVEHELEGR